MSLFIALLLLALGGKGDFANQQPLGQNGGAIVGMIQDDRGAAVPNAKVTLTGGDASESKSTQAEGRFEFRNLKPGQYHLTVEAPKFRKEAIAITLRPDEIFLAPPIKLKPSSLHVAVLDASNQPLAGVTVSLYAKERAATGALAARNAAVQLDDKTTSENSATIVFILIIRLRNFAARSNI